MPGTCWPNMPADPKPEKTEHSTLRGGRQRGRERAWKRDEREDARWLQRTYGPETDPVIRHLVTSTGRIGHLVALGYDSTSEHAIGESKDHSLPKWLIDLWSQAQTSHDGIEAEHNLPAWLADAWAQINQSTVTRPTRRAPVM